MSSICERDDTCRRSLLSVLADDVLLRICRFLPANTLLGTGVACADLHQRTNGSLELWQELCKFFLGETSLVLHESSWSASAEDASQSSFYRRLFKAAWACEAFCYDNGLRKTLLSSVEQRHQADMSSHTQSQSADSDLLCMSGHTSETWGSLVLQIGGMRNTMPQGAPLHVTMVDLVSKRVFRPSLKAGSCNPEHRMRHSTCVVDAPFLPAGALSREAVLVLGGHGTPGAGHDSARPRANVQTLLLLQITREDGSEICWHELSATGAAPEYIYNHACASFAKGTRVCVFGGDIPREDPEYSRIEHRMNSPFIYVLDVAAQAWQVVETGGCVPSWRSFHAAVAHTSLADGNEYFVIFGGTADHCDPLTGGSLADMTGYELDLQRFTWRRGPSDGFIPAARMRFGTARWGRHALVHGGHGQHTHDAYVVKLNLSTLRWARVCFVNEAPPLPSNAFETGSPQAGVVVGGARQTLMGPRILTRLKLFRLSDPIATHDADASGEEEEETMNQDAQDEEDEAMQSVRVHFQGADGAPRIVQMPIAMMLGLHRRAGSEEALAGMMRELLARQEAADGGEEDNS